jgi:hypothetical protein
VAWLDVEAFDCCTCLCVYCISHLQFSDIGGMAVDEQRVCIKFCVRLNKTGRETFDMLKQAFGDSCMSCSQTFEWFGCFKNGRTANDDRSGRPSTATAPQKWKRYGRLLSRSAPRHRPRLVNSPKNGRVQLGISWFRTVAVAMRVKFIMSFLPSIPFPYMVIVW